MCVYVVMSDHIYEGDHIYGVFDSEEKANEAAAAVLINHMDVRIEKIQINTLND